MNKSNLFQEIIVKNPVLIGSIGLCPIVAICTSLKAAVVMSIITILTLIVAQAISSLIFKHLPQWFRMGLYMLVGMLIVIPSSILLGKISAEMMLALGIYLPLLAVNPVIVRQCEREGVNIGLKDAFVNSICAGIGYSVVLIIVGLFRELIGSGTIWGFSVSPLVPIPSFLTPMGGFIIIAVLAALLRSYFRKMDPEYAEELAVNSRTAIKKNRNIKNMILDIDENSDENSETAVVTSEKISNRTAKNKIEKPSIQTTNQKYQFITLDLPSASDKKLENETNNEIKVLDDKPEVMSPENDGSQEKKVDKASSKTKTEKNESLKEVVAEEKQPVVDANVDTDANANVDVEKNPSEVNISPKKKAPSTKSKARADTNTESKPNAQKTSTEKKPSTSKIATSKKSSASKTNANKKANSEKATASKKTANTKSTTTKKPKNTTSKKEGSSIVYKSDELEKLMNMSLDDILNGIPDEGNIEGGNDQ